jgi:hypothetical protein
VASNVAAITQTKSVATATISNTPMDLAVRDAAALLDKFNPPLAKINTVLAHQFCRIVCAQSALRNTLQMCQCNPDRAIPKPLAGWEGVTVRRTDEPLNTWVGRILAAIIPDITVNNVDAASANAATAAVSAILTDKSDGGLVYVQRSILVFQQQNICAALCINNGVNSKLLLCTCKPTPKAKTKPF